MHEHLCADCNSDEEGSQLFTMSSKFKKQQKKRRWSECGVSAPAWYTEQVGLGVQLEAHLMQQNIHNLTKGLLPVSDLYLGSPLC